MHVQSCKVVLLIKPIAFFFLTFSYLSRRWILKSLVGSLSNDNGDVNENGKKSIGFNWQNNNLARASRFFVHLFAVTARQQREKNSRFVEDVNTRQRLPFSFPELPKND